MKDNRAKRRERTRPVRKVQSTTDAAAGALFLVVLILTAAFWGGVLWAIFRVVSLIEAALKAGGA